MEDASSLTMRSAQCVNVNNKKERLHLKGLERSLENAFDVKKHIYRQEERDMMRHLQKLQREKEIRHSSYSIQLENVEDMKPANNHEYKESWDQNQSSHQHIHDCRYNTSCHAHHMLPPVDGSRDFHVRPHHGHGHGHHHGHGHGHHHHGHHNHHNHHGHGHHHAKDHHLHPEQHLHPGAHPVQHHSIHRLQHSQRHLASDVARDDHRGHATPRHDHGRKDSHLPDVHHADHRHGKDHHSPPNAYHGHRRHTIAGSDERHSRPANHHLLDGRFHQYAWHDDSHVGQPAMKPRPPSSAKPEGQPKKTSPSRHVRKDDIASKDSEGHIKQNDNRQDKSAGAKRRITVDQTDEQILSRSPETKPAKPAQHGVSDRRKEQDVVQSQNETKEGDSKPGNHRIKRLKHEDRAMKDVRGRSHHTVTTSKEKQRRERTPVSPKTDGQQGSRSEKSKQAKDEDPKSKSYHAASPTVHAADVTRGSQSPHARRETPDSHLLHHHGDRHVRKGSHVHIDHMEPHSQHGSSEGDTTNPVLTALKSINPSFYRYLAEKHNISLNPELLAQLHTLMKSSTDVLHGSHPERILPQVFGPHCTTGRAHRKKMLALEFLTKMLPEIVRHAENPDFNPQETLQCRYLRLSGSNVEALEGMCRQDGADVEIHPHSHIDDLARFVFAKTDERDAESREGHSQVSIRQQ